MDIVKSYYPPIEGDIDDAENDENDLEGLI
jgi:hypothetical protein